MLFLQQEQDLRRAQTLREAVKTIRYIKLRVWYHRRYGAVGLAMVVGAYALWLGRNGGHNTGVPLFGPLGGYLMRFLGGPA